jgi:hypothetical protein
MFSYILTWSLGREGLVSLLQLLIYLVMEVDDFPEFFYGIKTLSPVREGLAGSS